MNIIDYAEKNREAWNQVTPIHQKHRKTNLREAVQSPSFLVLRELETAMFRRLNISGKRVAHVCCNNGRELISVLKMGAASGVGFDISDEAIKEAKTLAESGQVNCEFIRTNVYDIDGRFFNQFDVAYITIGAITWLDDLHRFFKIVSHLLIPGGHLFMYEAHPFLDMIALPGEDVYDDQNPLKIAYSYFKSDAYIDNNGLDYIGGTTYDAKTSYSFAHTVSDILKGILTNGMALLDFQEYAHDISASFHHLEQYHMLPMCYTLLAKKQFCG
jgi:2-polyprenyl-3-methyl-5-hydroxy-6-metoxy-1,4-benzoquinol methylase